MSTTLATYIALPGNAAEAFEHWHEVFGGDLDLMRYGDMQLEDALRTEPSTRSPRGPDHSGWPGCRWGRHGGR